MEAAHCQTNICSWTHLLLFPQNHPNTISRHDDVDLLLLDVLQLELILWTRFKGTFS